ncbi:hypothetical protein EVAR_90088_1 [Eumeta japonica]|uniref:Uncharacterized protein n=1 Tax=Eumeta variegata TaxID=151549 RepID=A0A4C1X264_EUMVA|nr:hypothetical protein EVAR_90088_1 [Eumeta japonica]
MPANGFQRPVIDQSQTGELNVHINLKDLHILALLKGRTEEYVDYDYAYDYSEMTIKPNNSTTPKPANVSNVTEENATETTTQLVTERPTSAINVTAAPPTAETTVTAPPAGAPHNASTTVHGPLADTTTSAPAPKNATECRKNYVKNKNGECEFTLYDSSSTNA